MEDVKKQASRDVLKKLIAMCQQMMVDGMGDSEAAGDEVKDKLGDELQEEPVEAAAEDGAESDSEPSSLQEHIRSEMKKGKRSPVKAGRSVAIMFAKPEGAMTKAGKGRY